ncbi:MAG: hypothetical protein HYW70_00005, partial [Candidatus Nealsonbacteria bacterium]|nr:hypothetical protein [Candidatus Nealsonbacteria bacterium]
TAGLNIITTLNWEFQEVAEKTVADGTRSNKAFDAQNAALTAIDPKTGQILAMVGSADYFATSSYPAGCQEGLDCKFEPKVNAAAYGNGRQPGSAFKPFAYAQAFIKGYTPETTLWDAKTEFNPDCPENATGSDEDQFGEKCYHPENYDGKFRGKITMREALAQSINIPSIKTLYLAGIKETIGLAQNMGITTLNKPLSWYGLSLVLGGGEVRLLDLVSAYSVFANDGLRLLPSPILKIEDERGNIIEENKKTPRRVLESEIARLVNNILSDNESRIPIFGRASPLFIGGYDVAAKTGTTQDFRDGWIIGYSPTLAAGVWVGNNDNSEMKKEPGVVLAGPIWNRFMREALKKFPKEDFPKPDEKDSEKPALEIESSLSNDDPQYQNWQYGIQSWTKNKQP